MWSSFTNFATLSWLGGFAVTKDNPQSSGPQTNHNWLRPRPLSGLRHPSCNHWSFCVQLLKQLHSGRRAGDVVTTQCALSRSSPSQLCGQGNYFLRAWTPYRLFSATDIAWTLTALRLIFYSTIQINGPRPSKWKKKITLILSMCYFTSLPEKDRDLHPKPITGHTN